MTIGTNVDCAHNSENMMRVKAMFRRIEMIADSENNEARANNGDCIKCGDISIYPERLTAYCNNGELSLTNREFSMLEYMLKNSDRVVTREELLTEIWGYDSIVETRVTDDTVKRIRRKLSTAKSRISIDTVWGQGFRLIVKELV